MNSIEASHPTTQNVSQETPRQISTEGTSEEEVQSRTPEAVSAKKRFTALCARHDANLIERKRRRAAEAVGSREMGIEPVVEVEKLWRDQQLEVDKIWRDRQIELYEKRIAIYEGFRKVMGEKAAMDEERILAIDLDKCNRVQRMYYKKRQEDILAKPGL